MTFGTVEISPIFHVKLGRPLKGLFTVSDRDSDLLWVQCTSMDLFTVSVCISDSDSDIAIAKSGMGATPKFSDSN